MAKQPLKLKILFKTLVKNVRLIIKLINYTATIIYSISMFIMYLRTETVFHKIVSIFQFERFN